MIWVLLYLSLLFVLLVFLSPPRQQEWSIRIDDTQPGTSQFILSATSRNVWSRSNSVQHRWAAFVHSFSSQLLQASLTAGGTIVPKPLLPPVSPRLFISHSAQNSIQTSLVCFLYVRHLSLFLSLCSSTEYKDLTYTSTSFPLLRISSCHHLRIWTTALLLSCRCLSGGSVAPPLGSLQPSLFPVADSFIPSPPPNLSKLINRPQSPRERKASPSSLPSRLSRALSLGTIPSISRAGASTETSSRGKSCVGNA